MSLGKMLTVSLVAVCSAFGGPVLFDTTGDASNGNGYLIPTEYQSFSTGASAFTLQDLKVIVIGNPDSSHSFGVAIYSDSSSTPGALFTSVGSVSDTLLPGNGFATIDLSGLSISLSAGTRYWVGLSTTSGGGASWALGTPTGGDTGVTGQFYDDGGFIHSTGGSSVNEAFLMQLSGTTATGNVPEPASFLLGGTGLFALLCLRRQKQGRSADQAR